MVERAVEIRIREVPAKRAGCTWKRGPKGSDGLRWNYKVAGLDINVYINPTTEGDTISTSCLGDEGQLGILLHKHKRLQKGSSRGKVTAGAAKGVRR